MNIKEQIQEAIQSHLTEYEIKADGGGYDGEEISEKGKKALVKDCEAIVDDVAIEFAEWCLYSEDIHFDRSNPYTYNYSFKSKLIGYKELFTYFKENVYGKD